MKLFEIATNQQNTTEIEQTIKFFNERVKVDCRQYLNLIKTADCMLYRGISNQYNRFDTLLTHDKRQPLSTHPIISNIVDEYLTKHTGIAFRTSNALFTTPEIEVTAEYGDPFCVFPIGPTNFIFFEHINDLFFDISEYLDLNSDVSPEGLDQVTLRTDIFEWLDKKKLYHNSNLRLAAHKIPSSEVIFNTKSYHIISFEMWEQIEDKITY